ncbi:MAG: hypothetical protein KC933_02510, partial [Myxococcales bacterium]|nr:hypothetical protein [Myxococcales bacterium]
MTCRDKEALRLKRLTQPQLDAWILHAETCLDCAPLLRDVSESYQRLRAPVPPPTPERTAALWRAIEAQARMAPRPREVRPLWPAALFASAALAAALLWSSGPTAPSPETVYTALAAGEAIPIGAATLRASTAATVRVVEDPPLTRVFVASGDVELDAPALVDPSRTNVETPHVSLVRVAGRVSLSVEPDHTRLHVRVGEVHTEAGVEYQADTTVTFPEVFGQGGARDRVAPAPT